MNWFIGVGRVSPSDLFSYHAQTLKKSGKIKPAFEAALLRLYLNIIYFNYCVFKIPMLIYSLKRLIMCVGWNLS